MASSAEMDFNCPVCLEVFKNPVVLSCSHSFCKACLQNWWAQKVTRECPVCKRRSSRTNPPCNLVLKNLCEAFSQQLSLGQGSAAGHRRVSEQQLQSAPLCSRHKEKLQLFCLDHQQLVCLLCRDSRAHHKHRFRPIDEMAQERREELEESMQWTLESMNQVEVLWDGTAEHIKQQGQHTERLIKGQFDQIRAFLQREEQARINALRSEVEQKTLQVKRKRVALKQEKEKMFETIQVIKTQLKCDDVSLLQNSASALKSLHECGRDFKHLPSGALVDVAKHLGNLGFHIWNQMKGIVSYTPVVLDPNTANDELIVSDDLKSAHFTETDTLSFLDNPERIQCQLMVLGTEEFSSGFHSWQVDIQGEVDVNDDAGWAVGVVTTDAPRHKPITSGSWEIWLRNGKYTAFAPPHIDKVLSFPTVRRPLRRIRVDLDMEGGYLTFSDPHTGTKIYTYKNLFNKNLHPFVSTSAAHNVTILPLNISVSLQKEKRPFSSVPE